MSPPLRWIIQPPNQLVLDFEGPEQLMVWLQANMPSPGKPAEVAEPTPASGHFVRKTEQGMKNLISSMFLDGQVHARDEVLTKMEAAGYVAGGADFFLSQLVDEKVLYRPKRGHYQLITNLSVSPRTKRKEQQRIVDLAIRKIMKRLPRGEPIKSSRVRQELAALGYPVNYEYFIRKLREAGKCSAPAFGYITLEQK